MDFGDPAKVVGCQQHPIRWDKVAEGIGCYGALVTKPADLISEIKKAKESELPAVVCIKTDKQANLIPPGAEQLTEVYTGVEGD